MLKGVLANNSISSLWNYYCGNLYLNENDYSLVNIENGNVYSLSFDGNILEVSLLKANGELNNDLVYAKFDLRNTEAVFNILQGNDLVVENYTKIKKNNTFELQVYGYKNVKKLLDEENVRYNKAVNLKDQLGLSNDFGKVFVVDNEFKVAYSDEIIEEGLDYIDIPNPEQLDFSKVEEYNSTCDYLRIVSNRYLLDNNCQVPLQKVITRK